MQALFDLKMAAQLQGDFPCKSLQDMAYSGNAYRSSSWRCSAPERKGGKQNSETVACAQTR
jgi:hypothetical protein